MKLQALILIGMSIITIGTASIAEAKKIRSPADRRHRPELGFWENDEKPRQSNTLTRKPIFGNQINSHWTAPKTSGPTKKSSWGWQRSSRAEYHHPGTGRTR